MPMNAGDIEKLIKTGIPDAKVTIRDLAGDGDHYAAEVVSGVFAARAGCSSTRWSTTRLKEAWAAFCTHWRCRPACRTEPIWLGFSTA